MNPLELENEENAQEVARFFSNLRLPLPDKGEYYETADKGRIAFLSAYGSLIRITKKEFKAGQNHPCFLRPIFARTAGIYIAELYPGIDTPLTEEESDRAGYMLLKKYSIYTNDNSTENFGFLPGSGRSHPLVIDPDGRRFINISEAELRKLRKSPDALERLVDNPPRFEPVPIPGPAAPEPQDALYANLREIAREAWADGSPYSNAQAVVALWDAHLEMKARGKLLACWKNHDFCGTRDAARNYAAKIAASQPSI